MVEVAMIVKLTAPGAKENSKVMEGGLPAGATGTGGAAGVWSGAEITDMPGLGI